MLAYLAGNVGPSCGYVGLCWPYVDPCWAKRSEKWEQQKKDCKTQDILMVGSLSWGYVGPSWGYVGPSWSYVGPSWGYVGPSWGYVGPSWGLCWPILGLCWPILRPMLAHPEAFVGPSWPILNHKTRKIGKNGKSTKHRKTRDFLAGPGGSAAGGAAPLSYGEERNAFGNATARGPLAGFKGFRPCRRPRKRICKGSLAEVNVRKVPHVLWTMQLFEKVKQYLAKYTWYADDL